ncbi:hypothetical protein ABT282_08500 [Streptomyces sp. NPDC000927]|uniref:hypothetical protein n=1 Tax=Streptomyces sp. NPDC000927 TaxID=3154371 RepID=UPI00332FD1B6
MTTTPTPADQLRAAERALYEALATGVKHAQIRQHLIDQHHEAVAALAVARQILSTMSTETPAADDNLRRVPIDLGLPPAEEITLLRRTLEAAEEGRAELRAENARLRAALGEQGLKGLNTPTVALDDGERQFLAFALDLAADETALRGDEFTDEDHAALERLRLMAAPAVTEEHHTVAGARYLCHTDDHYCPQAPAAPGASEEPGR